MMWSTTVRVNGKLGGHVSVPQSLLDELNRAAQGVALAVRELGPAVQRGRTPGARVVSAASQRPRVERGVRLLDSALGREFWLPRVNVATLNVASTRHCVACQVTGLRYSDALDALGFGSHGDPYARAARADRCGFSNDLIFPSESSYAALTEAWVTVVTELRAEVANASDSVRITA